MIDEKNLIKADENGVIVPDEEQIEKLVALKEAKEEEAKSFSEQVKEVLLNLMAKYGCPTIKCANYTVSKVGSADKEVFNEEDFLLNVPEEILADFVTVVETSTFDEEKFKAENPELYAKYVNTDITSSVNTKKLSKSNPSLYEKYVTKVKSDKAPTIKIVANKKNG
jgi:hypothetical protein